MKPEYGRYYSISGTNTKGLNVSLPVVSYDGWFKRNTDDVMCHTFLNHRSCARISFEDGKFSLSDVQWDKL